MSAKWAVTAAVKEVTLDDQRRGEVTFTVTNQGDTADRAVFDVIAGKGADPSWFSVEDPQRPVRAGASVSYVMKVVAPPETPPGKYQVQGLVYSADLAPEENQGTSPSIAVEVKAAEAPAKRKWPWWWFAIAGGVVVVLVVVLALVFTGGDGGEPAAQPTAGPAEQGIMPDVRGLTESAALAALSERGITVRPILYQHDPEQDGTVVDQWTESGVAVEPELGVTIVAATNLTAPVITGPVGVVDLVVDAPGGEPPELTWDPGRTLARRWMVTMFYEQCTLGNVGHPAAFSVTCEFTGPSLVQPSEEPSLIPEMPYPAVMTAVPGSFVTGWYRWYVEPMDDLGNRGEQSEHGYFRLQRVAG
jgi:hypothetical protein